MTKIKFPNKKFSEFKIRATIKPFSDDAALRGDGRTGTTNTTI
jgi:hypothetical protein